LGILKDSTRGHDGQPKRRVVAILRRQDLSRDLLQRRSLPLDPVEQARLPPSSRRESGIVLVHPRQSIPPFQIGAAPAFQRLITLYPFGDAMRPNEAIKQFV